MPITSVLGLRKSTKLPLGPEIFDHHFKLGPSGTEPSKNNRSFKGTVRSGPASTVHCAMPTKLMARPRSRAIRVFRLGRKIWDTFIIGSMVGHLRGKHYQTYQKVVEAGNLCCIGGIQCCERGKK